MKAGTMNCEAFERIVNQYLPVSFTAEHMILLKICFGDYTPDPLKVEPLNEYLENVDFERLSYMVKVEFASSLQKELLGTDETVVGPVDPHPYDVFLMETTLSSTSRSIAVCLPIRNSKKIAWYDGGEDLIPVDDCLVPRWRVGSLSGSARVLIALAQPSSNLTVSAMRRELLVQAVDLTEQVATNCLNHEVCKSMNVSQRRAVATISSPFFQRGFFAIQGPPGCGKTTTMVGMILNAIDKGDVLVTAPSNAAVANVALKLFTSHRFALQDVVVFGQNCDPSVHFLSPTHRGMAYEKLTNELEKISEDSEHYISRLNKFISWLHLPDFSSSLADLAWLCPPVHSEVSGTRRLADALSFAKIVLCTLNSAGSSFLQGAIKVDTILLDEAGQTPEADFYIATEFPNVQRIIVVGDPLQLPATVTDYYCSKVGFGKSWLEKVFKIAPESVHVLDTQYRMDPKIFAFPNKTFYRNRILSGDNVLFREPYVGSPFLFVDTAGRGSEEKDQFSYRNAYEATVIKSILTKDVDIRNILQHCPCARIIVISPYRAQTKLLKETLAVIRHCVVDVATVDSFQGQEGDIVIISTVRTRFVGFVDSVQRLNVALTRAKRVLRFVGDSRLFLSLNQASTLKKISLYAEHSNLSEKSCVRSLPWSSPNWGEYMCWKPLMNVRFADCLQKMSTRDKNVCLNTLRAVALPDLEALGSTIPQRSVVSWYTSWLSSYGCCLRIVWIPKQGNVRPTIEAHFAGTDDACRRFIQLNRHVPAGSCIVEKDMSGLNNLNTVENLVSNQPLATWPVTNAFQKVLFTPKSLPDACVQLDPAQELVATANPPLMIESRSGTGKTLVLLQHAAYHSDRNLEKPVLFVTVSPRLCKQLRQKYDEIDVTENYSLPPMHFFPFQQFLHKLLEVKRIFDFKGFDPCRFPGYVKSRKSHESLKVETSLIENEIGGVIMGSLEAALQAHPLNRDQYLCSKRSNIENKSQVGIGLRNHVFNCYEEYSQWKMASNLFDLNDLVLRLLRWHRDSKEELFSACYLDEVQDLSYASIFLLCHLGGRSCLKWIAAGDPAQMISPGCSFTFDGLKQTFLAVMPGIEVKLKVVTHLLVNYRTTKDILILGNKIIDVIKKSFPDAIGFALPETAIKDLGFKVVLCDWELAYKQKVRLGRNQALIYSCDDVNEFEAKVNDWIGIHPFILSSIDSKGLEFDDVIVAFDLDRKVWNVKPNYVPSLRMLRELYVAVTRARRRVVILVQRYNPFMSSFFERFGYKFQTTGADMILREFELETTPTDWHNKGMSLYEDQQFKLAARCFDAAGDIAWSHWSYGQYLYAEGQTFEAQKLYASAMNEFYTRNDFQKVLDMALFIDQCSLTWSNEWNEFVVVSIRKCPNYLERIDSIRLSLRSGGWPDITKEELVMKSLSHIFLSYRDKKELQAFVKTLCKSQFKKILEENVPQLVGDYYREDGKFDEAVRFYLISADVERAALSTQILMKGIQQVQKVGKKQASIFIKAICYWLDRPPIPSGDHSIDILLRLYRSPVKEATGKSCAEHIKLLGRNIILLAFDHNSSERTLLYNFSSIEFSNEIIDVLVTRFAERPLEVVRWFLAKGNAEQAASFAKQRLSAWSTQELCILGVELCNAQDLNWLCNKIFFQKYTAQFLCVLAGNRSMTKIQKVRFMELFKTMITKARDTFGLRYECLCLDLFLISLNFQSVQQCWCEADFFRYSHELRFVSSVMTVVEVGRSPFDFGEEVKSLLETMEFCNLTALAVVKETALNDKIWLITAFQQNGIHLRSIPSQYAIQLLELALQRNFMEMATHCSWAALESPEAIAQNWANLLDLWSKSSLENRLLEFHSNSTSFLEVVVKQNPHFNNNPIVFKRKTSELTWACVCAAREDEKEWLILAFRTLLVDIAIPQNKLAIDVLRLAVQSKLPDLALECSWKALANRDVARQYWVLIFKLWATASEQFIVEAFGEILHHNLLMQALLVLNPFIKKDFEFESSPCFFLYHYGPSLYCYLHFEKSSFDVSASQIAHVYHAELERKLESHFIPAVEYKSEPQSIELIAVNTGKCASNIKGTKNGKKGGKQQKADSTPTLPKNANWTDKISLDWIGTDDDKPKSVNNRQKNNKNNNKAQNQQNLSSPVVFNQSKGEMSAHAKEWKPPMKSPDVKDTALPVHNSSTLSESHPVKNSQSKKAKRKNNKKKKK